MLLRPAGEGRLAVARSPILVFLTYSQIPCFRPVVCSLLLALSAAALLFRFGEQSEQRRRGHVTGFLLSSLVFFFRLIPLIPPARVRSFCSVATSTSSRQRRTRATSDRQPSPALRRSHHVPPRHHRHARQPWPAAWSHSTRPTHSSRGFPFSLWPIPRSSGRAPVLFCPAAPPRSMP